jgi:hypothetical protein
MQATGRTPILTKEQQAELDTRQRQNDEKRDTRKSMMFLVASQTDVVVKRAPLSKKGQLPHTRWDYHEKTVNGRRLPAPCDRRKTKS